MTSFTAGPAGHGVLPLAGFARALLERVAERRRDPGQHHDAIALPRLLTGVDDAESATTPRGLQPVLPKAVKGTG